MEPSRSLLRRFRFGWREEKTFLCSCLFLFRRRSCSGFPCSGPFLFRRSGFLCSGPFLFRRRSWRGFLFDLLGSNFCRRSAWIRNAVGSRWRTFLLDRAFLTLILDQVGKSVRIRVEMKMRMIIDDAVISISRITGTNKAIIIQLALKGQELGVFQSKETE